jgi:hypothetical protein
MQAAHSTHGSPGHYPRIAAAALAIFLAAFGLRIALVLLLPDFGILHTGEMEHVAMSWAATGELANPYATPTGPTAHVTPVYPILLGSIYRIFGTGAAGRLAQSVFGCTASAARCALLLPLAILLGLGIRTGLIASVLSLFYISAFNTEVHGSWEAPLMALFLMGVTALAVRFGRAPAFRFRTAAGYGVLAGFGVLLSPTVAPPMAAFLLCTVPLGRRQWKRYAAWLAVLGATAFAVVLPWLIRNERVLGSPVIRSNFGLELSLAYNDSEKASALDPGIVASHPLVNRAVSRHVAAVGEIAFNRERKKQALDWIRSHPAATLRLLGEHFVYFWFPPAANILVRAALAAVTLCAAIGLAILPRRSRLAARLIGLIWISFPLIYYITYWSSRYRYPMGWTLLLCTAVLLDSLWCKYVPHRVTPRV